MTIPRIAPYPLPSSDAIPRSRLRFRPDHARAALLVHDVQDYFLDFFDRCASPAAPMIENLGALIAGARRLGIPILFTAQPSQQSQEDRGLLQSMWGPGITAEPLRASIAAQVAPRPTDSVITKYRYSAFQRTDLPERLARLGRDQLIVTGLYAHIGCLLSTADAFMRDIEPFFVADALADFSREHHEHAIAHVASCTGTVVTTSELLDSLESKGAPGEAHPRGLEPSIRSQSGGFVDLREEIAALLEIDASELSPETNLLDWGLDSLRIMTLVERFRARGLDVTFPDLAEIPTLQHYTSLIERASTR